MVKKSPAVKKSWLEKVLGGGVVLIFAVLPLLYFSNRVASYVTSKEYFLIGIVEVLAILWLWLLLIDRRYRLSRKNLFFLLPLLLFLCSLTISAIIGADPATSFFSTVESGTGLILLYHIFLFACIISSFIRVQQERFFKSIIQANLLASVLLAGATFLTGAHGIVDLNSVMLDSSSGGAMMGNSLLVGAYFIFSLFLTLYLIFHEQQLWKKILYWISMAVIVLCPIYFNVAIFKGTLLSAQYSFIGEARVAAIALVTGLLLSVFVWLRTRKDHRTSRIISGIGIIVMVMVGGIGLQQITSSHSRLHAFFVNQSGNRIIDWQESLQGIASRPLLGWGPENFHVVYQKYLDPIIFSPGHGNEVWALHPHNNTLEVLVDGGIIGLILYLLVLVSLFGGLYRLYRNSSIDGKTFALFVGMLAAFIIQQQMIYDSIVSYTMFFLMIALVAGLSAIVDTAREKSTAVTSRAFLTMVLVIVILLPIWYCAAYLPARKTEELFRIASAPSDRRALEYQHLFHSAGSYAIDTDPEFYTDPLFYSYDAQKIPLKNNPLYQKVASQEIQALVTAVDPIWQKQQDDYHLSLSLIQLENLQFYLTGNVQVLARADVYAKRAFLLSPTDPQIYTAYAQTLVYEGNNAAAKTLLDQAVLLAPAYQSALSFKSMLESNNS